MRNGCTACHKAPLHLRETAATTHLIRNRLFVCYQYTFAGQHSALRLHISLFFCNCPYATQLQLALPRNFSLCLIPLRGIDIYLYTRLTAMAPKHHNDGDNSPPAKKPKMKEHLLPSEQANDPAIVIDIMEGALVRSYGQIFEGMQGTSAVMVLQQTSP